MTSARSRSGRHARPFVDVALNPKSYHPGVGPGVSAVEALINGAFNGKVVAEGSPVRTAMEEIKNQVDALLAAARGQ